MGRIAPPGGRRGALWRLIPVTACFLVTACLVAAAAAPGLAAPEGPATARPDLCEVASPLEVEVFRFLNDTIKNPVLDVVLPFVTDFKRWRFFALAVWVALLFWGGRRGRWAALLLIPLVAASDQATSGLIKPLVARVRPCEVLGDINFWYQGERWIRTPAEAVGGIKTSFGFPSSHAANLTASMLFLSLIFRRGAPLVFLGFAFLVSLSRIYIGVHWPTDVLAGAAIGALLAVPAYLGWKKLPGVTPLPRAPSPS
jgi:undecaprenyl-diphosphatase